MTTTTTRRSGRVLIILTGGNVSLMHARDQHNQIVLKPASVGDVRQFLLGSATADTLLLQEATLSGTVIHVDFEDLREGEGAERKYHDPEELDSAQVRPRLWSQIARTIKSHYDEYEGFVVLHGLDTMAYTASALAFMLTNLQRPVVLAGAQRPLNYARTDASQNIFTAVTLAAASCLGLNPPVNEVVIYSHDTLFRGNRASMCSASSYRSFDSPNFPLLASVGEHIEIQSHLVQKELSPQVLATKERVDASVVIMDVFPGMDARIIKGVLAEAGQTRGVLLRTYGMGTAPTSPSVLTALRDLAEAKIVVMNVTQARSGRISHGQDPVSLRLFEHGVVSGVDMTAEAAYAKMVVLLSESDDYPRVTDLLQIERAGEQSQSIFHIHFDANETRDDSSGSYRALLRSSRDVTEGPRIRQEIGQIDYIQLRLLGVEPSREEDRARNWGTEIDLTLVDPTSADVPAQKVVAHLKHDTLRWYSQGRETINVAYDITEHRDKLLSAKEIPSTYVRLESFQPIRWRLAAVVLFSHVVRDT